MHQSIPAAPSPPPPPGLLRGICPPCQSQGWGISKFFAARGPGICQPRGQTRAFNKHAVSFQHITTQRILLEKQAERLICQGREKIEEVKACSRCYACFSSLLIKAELHSGTRELLPTSRQWGGALRDDSKNGCVADYTFYKTSSSLQLGTRLLAKTKPNSVSSPAI